MTTIILYFVAMPQGNNERSFAYYAKYAIESESNPIKSALRKIGSFFSNLMPWNWNDGTDKFNNLSSSETNSYLPEGDSEGSASGFVKNLFSNLIRGYGGTGLTDAQLQANEFTHNERIESQDWMQQMDSTKYSRAVADARSAGINPMMVAGGTPSSPSSSGGQSVAPTHGFDLFAMLMSLAKLPAEIDLLKSQAEANRGRASESKHKLNFWDASAEQALQRVELMKSQIKTEGAKSEFYEARSVLANVSAENITYLQEAVKTMYEASAAASYAAAGVDAMHTLYEGKLIDSGYIEELVKRTQAETSERRAAAGEHSASARHHQASTVREEQQANLIVEDADAQDIANSIANGTFISRYGATSDFVTKFNYYANKILEPFKGIFSYSTSTTNSR